MIIFPLIPQGFASCIVNEDWSAAPCLDTIANGWYNQDEVDQWAEYYSFKGVEFMEEKKVEMDNAIKEERLDEWITESVQNENVWSYYYFSGRAPNAYSSSANFEIIQVSENDSTEHTIESGEIFEIKMNQVIWFEDLELHFRDIEDSRCPLDVTCVWEGKVTVMINIQNQTHKNAAYFTPGSTDTYHIPYEITLVDIQPHPISTHDSTDEYVATLSISIDDRESLRKGETLGGSAILGWGGLAGSLFIILAYIIMKKKKSKNS